MTFTTVGLPYFSARVKKIVPTADPANPENNRYPQVLVWILRISPKRDTRSGRNMIRISTCSQKTITLASNSALSGMRHALSVPHSAAPRPTSHGPYVAPVILPLRIRFSCSVSTWLRQCDVQLPPTGSPTRVRPVADKMPVGSTAKMAVLRRAQQSRPTIRLDLFYDMEFKTR